MYQYGLRKNNNLIEIDIKNIFISENNSKTMKLMIFFVLMTMSVFSHPTEFEIKVLSDDECKRMEEEYKNQDFKLPKLQMPSCYSAYCKIDENFAVFTQTAGSGRWVHDIYILARMKKGGWQEIQNCGFSTGVARLFPAKVRFENNVISVLTEKDKFLTSFDVSDVLDQINNK